MPLGRTTPRLRLIGQALDARLDEATTKARDLLDGDTDARRNVDAACAVGAEQHDAGTADMPGARSATRNQGFELATLGDGQGDFDRHDRQTDHRPNN